MEKNAVVLFTDGACSGNPGPGGWGFVFVDSGRVVEGGSFSPVTTNNQMELQAVISGLDLVQPNHVLIKVYTDSVYVIRGITQWIWGWQKNGWKTAEGNEVANKELWLELQKKVVSLKKHAQFEWHYVRGHQGTPGNERCDEIAVAASKGESLRLYSGALSSYGLDILRIPADTSLPEMKSPSEKKAAFSYLSNLGGIVYRHKTWLSCDRRVKGQSGAKFKKATSASHEIEILKEWGLPAHHVVIDGE
ncbi:MAG: ribonuclease HI [Bdellovibrionia bacterium]